nr:MAG TPA: hypothetical protein [Caudoviricetes sp.]
MLCKIENLTKIRIRRETSKKVLDFILFLCYNRIIKRKEAIK